MDPEAITVHLLHILNSSKDKRENSAQQVRVTVDRRAAARQLSEVTSGQRVQQQLVCHLQGLRPTPEPNKTTISQSHSRTRIITHLVIVPAELLSLNAPVPPAEPSENCPLITSLIFMCDFITFLRCSHPHRQILYVSQPNTSLYSNRFLQKLPQMIPDCPSMLVWIRLNFIVLFSLF